MDNRSIGIFDSGYGGLTSVRTLIKLLPEENFVFFGDNGRAPYGVRSRDELRKIVMQDIAFLEMHSIKALIVACGTSYAAGNDIIDSLSCPATGVVIPAVEKLAAIGTGGRPVGIIATGFSIRSGIYEKLIAEKLPGTNTVSVPCPDFVTLVEAGKTSKDDPDVADACRMYLEPIRAAGAGSIILGCTHFGLLSEAIGAYLRNDVVQIEASACAAEYMADYLKANDMLSSEGKHEYYTSGSVEEFNKNAPVFLEGADTVKSVHTSADAY